MTRSTALLLLLSLAACVHHSPDEAVLAPLVAQFTQESFEQRSQPEYLIFGDELTANVFKSLSRNPHYRILPRGKPFVCPAGATPCPKQYQLRARVGSIIGDTAIAVIERAHADGPDGGQRIIYGEQILLIRRNGRWEVEKVLGYSATMPM